MCGRYTLTSQADLVTELELARGEPTDAASEWWRPRWNIAPTQPAPVVFQDREGARVLELMRWGLVPHWADDLSIGARMINARVEGITTKPAFRDVIKRRRCLVPADGFFEWRTIGGKRRPLFIHPEPRHVVTFAGVYSKWRSKDPGNLVEVMSYSIITVPAAARVQPVHDRMPLVLPPAQRATWLDRSIVETGPVEAMLAAASDLAGWELTPVSMRVNKPDNDDPSCLEPPGPEEDAEPATTAKPAKAKRGAKAATTAKKPSGSGSGQGSLF
jgi:putative SOS response-associated peptidase YedK